MTGASAFREELRSGHPLSQASLAEVGRRGRSSARLVAATLLVLLPVGGMAVTPASPRLDQASRLGLVRELSTAGISEIESSAVLNALLAVLGTGPAARRYRYREPYPQLPDVDAEAVEAEKGCAKVQLTARPKAAPARPIAIEGIYCLLDPGSLAWTARSLSVEPR